MKMTRLCGRCPIGERLTSPVPHGHWKTLTFIAALRNGRIDAPWVIDGPMDVPCSSHISGTAWYRR
ncbi:MAG: hypothetical protein AAGA21_05540 [Pseudomonadota bacterium]